MTQHKWNTTDGFEVLAGWDRPLQHYFLQISRTCSGCHGEGETETGAECFNCGGRGEQFAFDNLSDTEFTDVLGGMSIDQITAALTKHLTVWPQQFLNDVVVDRIHNVGNQITTYDAVGSVKA